MNLTGQHQIQIAGDANGNYILIQAESDSFGSGGTPVGGYKWYWSTK